MFSKHGRLRKKSKEIYLNLLEDPTLAEIGRIHRTDKVDQNHTFNGLSYLDIYEKYLHEFRDKYVSILEIGVRNAESLRTWKSYFKNGKVFGIDIDPSCKSLEEKRIKIEIGSQDDINFLQRCFEGEAEFDIIIDDGSHVNSMTIASFEYLFNNRLKSGGIYIIEDLACSYLKLETDHNVSEKWPGMKFNASFGALDNDRKEMEDFFLEKIKRLDHLQGNILCLHFWSMVCVIIKI